MAKAFSVASWNVEHFGDDRNPQKIANAIRFASEQDPDVLAIYEVRSSHVFRALMDQMPDHHFFITEGEQMQEILVGVRKSLPAFITQKTEFKSGQTTLRPGVLVTLRVDGEYYPILFLHLKSMPDPKGFGLRHDMMRRAFDFRLVLNDAAERVALSEGQEPKPANYIFCGDLNTMGFDYYPRDEYDIPAEGEIAELHRAANYRDMKVLTKNADHTWFNGSASSYPPSDLDHAVAAEHLQFKMFGGREIDVRGWPELDTVTGQDDWIASYSDHALLYFEVQKV